MSDEEMAAALQASERRVDALARTLRTLIAWLPRELGLRGQQQLFESLDAGKDKNHKERTDE